MAVFRLASGDCREIMVANVDVTPDVDGLVLGMEWMRDNTCMWNVRTGRVSAIDDIVFHAEYDRDANLVKRVTPLPEIRLGLVTVRGPDFPMEWESESSPKTWGIEDDEPVVAIEELLPIRVHHIIDCLLYTSDAADE